MLVRYKRTQRLYTNLTLFSGHASETAKTEVMANMFIIKYKRHKMKQQNHKTEKEN